MLNSTGPSTSGRRIPARLWRFCRRPFTGLLLTLATVAGSSAVAQDIEPGRGIMGRIGHIEGQGIPQYRAITPVELFPYIMLDESLIFSDLRVFPTNQGEFGGNVGAGYRQYFEEFDRIVGISGWYDADATRGPYLQQLGLSLETYAGPLDARINMYLPVGKTTITDSLTILPASTRFDGNSLIYDQARSYFVAMKGIDFEVGAPLPSEFSADHGIRAYVGGYHYQGSDVDNITGASTRLQANIVAGLDASVQVTYDDFYKTRAFAGFSWTFGVLHRSQLQQDNARGRFGEHVTRNYTTVAPGRHSVERLVAVDPNNGTPYTFAHVSSSAAAGGTGAVNSPFQSIAAAQAAGANIVIVQAGSTFNGAAATIVAGNGQRIFGDGTDVAHFIPVLNRGTLLLPQAAAGLRPVLNGSPGDTITLANNSEISGFTITNSGGNAISGNGVQNIMVNQLAISGAAMSGLNFTNTSGSYLIDSTSIANSAMGVSINGGNGQFRFTGPLAISNTTGAAVSMKNLATDAVATFGDITVNSRQGRGLELDAFAGTLNVNGLTTITNESNSVASAIDIRNSPGTLNFAGVTVTNTTGAPGVNLQSNAGTTTIQRLDISSQNGTALKADGVTQLNINPTVANVADLSKNGSITAVNGTGVDIQNSNLNVSLKAINSTNAVSGIRMVNTTGTFATYGDGTDGSGGTITGATNAILLQNAGTVGFQWLALNNNVNGINANNVAYLQVQRGLIQNNTGFGIDTRNVTALVVANTTMNGNTLGNIRGQFDQVRSYAYSINSSNLTSSTANNVQLNTLAGGEGSILNLSTSGSGFATTLAGAAGIRTDWNGTLTASIDQSAFTMGGATTNGLVFNNVSTTAPSTVSITNTTFLGTGGSNTAALVNTANASTVVFGGNEVQFNSSGGTGLQLTLPASSTVNIASNTFVDTVDGATGVLFSSIKGPGNVTIEDNTLTFANTGVLLDRGIVFSSIDTAGGLLTLSGTKNNVISGAGTTFFSPFGTTAGGILVNGVQVK